MVTLTPRNHLRPLVTSDEHPYYVLRRSEVRSPAGRRRADLSTVPPHWVPAHAVQAGDFVLSPVFEGEPVDTLDMARLFGCYAGNGRRIIQRTGKRKDGPHRLMGFTISGNLAQPEIRQDIAALITRVAINPSTLKIESGKEGYDLRTYDQQLAARLVSECGDLCKDKRVPAYLFTASVQERLAFLGGLIDTDGSVDLKSGTIRIPLTTEKLVTDSYLLSLSCGIRGSVCEYDNLGYGGDVTKPTRTICLSIPASHFAMLSLFSWKVKHWGCSRKPGGVAFDYLHGGVRYVALEVNQVSTAADDVRLYNVSVEEDESYVAEGIVVHNCSICNHFARRPADRCTSREEGGKCALFGCLNGMLKIASDGRMNYVDNPVNRFYDISSVRIGADAVAHGLLLPIGEFQKKFASLDRLDMFDIQTGGEPLNGLEQTGHRLAVYWSELESKQAISPDDLDGGYATHAVQPLSHIRNLHSPNIESRQAAVRYLATERILPDFRTFAKAAALSDTQIEAASSYLPNLYTRLIRDGGLRSVLKRAAFTRIYDKNVSDVFASGQVSGIDLRSVTRRALLLNANRVELTPRKVAAFGELLPSVVADYAAMKLAFFVARDRVDTAALRGVVRRDLFETIT